MSTSVTGLRRQVILRQIQRCSQEYGPRSPATRLWQDELQRFDNDQNKDIRINKCFIGLAPLTPQ